MKLSELTEAVGVKRFAGQTSEKVLRYLSQLGSGPVRSLGRGGAGAAIQIGDNVYKLWMVDSAYEDYVKYCMAHQDNPFLPKFFGRIKTMPAFFVRHIDAPDEVKYVKMEKLEKYSTRAVFGIDMDFEDEDDEDENGHKAVVSFDDVVDHVSEFVGDGDPVQRFMLWLGKKHRHEYEKKQLDSKLVLLINTLQDISKLGHTWDIHHGNVAQRKSGEPVILDPIANEEDMKLNVKFDKLNARIEIKYELPSDKKKAGARSTKQPSNT